MSLLANQARRGRAAGIPGLAEVAATLHWQLMRPHTDPLPEEVAELAAHILRVHDDENGGW